MVASQKVSSQSNVTINLCNRVCVCELCDKTWPKQKAYMGPSPPLRAEDIPATVCRLADIFTA